MITTKGGIKLFKPVDTAEKEKYAGQRGRLIATSPLAFTYERWPDGASPPKAGQKVIFSKYSGVRMESTKDGREYLLLKDKDIVCTEDE
jgi:co-chaperonin GroES (HSP10)